MCEIASLPSVIGNDGIFFMNLFSRSASFILQVWATAGIAFERLLTQRFLSLASIA